MEITTDQTPWEGNSSTLVGKMKENHVPIFLENEITNV